MIEFKITDAADQQFAAVLAGRRVTIRLRYNPTSDRWAMDLAIDDQPVLHGRRIVTGVNLIAPFDFNIGVLFAFSPGTEDPKPDRQALPAGTVRLYHTTEQEISDAAIFA
jgi:hypothetical protein